ncbi:MAG TPA: hypothetical protein VGI20_07595 [Rhizomicrobium sp.]
MIVYLAVPYLLAAAPLVIVLLSILVGSCTMTRPGGEPMDRAQFYSQADSRAGEELVRELNRRAAREELQHTMEEAQR